MTPQSDAMILIRTHFVDGMITDLAARLSRETGWRVSLLLDGIRANPANAGSQEHILLTTGLLQDLGLYVPHDAPWRCGDYALYAARQTYRDVSFFWMIEPDVRINLPDLGDFFHLFARHPEYDLLATFLGIADESYPWTAMMKPFAVQPWKCMFPITRFSVRALDYLLERRRELGQRFRTERLADGSLRSQDLFPNDEVFAATELHSSDFVCRDINDTGIRFYDQTSFSFAFPIPDKRLRGMTPDGRIYHPVDVSSEYLRKVRGRFEHIRNHGGPADLIRTLFDRPELIADVRLECGDPPADRFKQDVAEAIAKLESL